MYCIVYCGLNRLVITVISLWPIKSAAMAAELLSPVETPQLLLIETEQEQPCVTHRDSDVVSCESAERLEPANEVIDERAADGMNVEHNDSDDGATPTTMSDHHEASLHDDNDLNQSSDDVHTVLGSDSLKPMVAVLEEGCRTCEESMLIVESDQVNVDLPSSEPLLTDSDVGRSRDVGELVVYTDEDEMSRDGDVIASDDHTAIQSRDDDRDKDTDEHSLLSATTSSQCHNTDDVIACDAHDAVTSPEMYSHDEEEATNVETSSRDQLECKHVDMTSSQHSSASVNHQAEADRTERIPDTANTSQTVADHDDTVTPSDLSVLLNTADRSNDEPLGLSAGDAGGLLHNAAADAVSMETDKHTVKPGCTDDRADVFSDCPVESSCDGSFELSKDRDLFDVVCGSEASGTEESRDETMKCGQMNPNCDNSLLYVEDDGSCERSSVNGCHVLSSEQHHVGAIARLVHVAEDFQPIPYASNMLDDDFTISHHSYPVGSQALAHPVMVYSASSQTVIELPVVEPLSNVSTQEDIHSADLPPESVDVTCDDNSCPIVSDKTQTTDCIPAFPDCLERSGERQEDIELLTGMEMLASVCESLVNHGSSESADGAHKLDDGQKSIERTEENRDVEYCAVASRNNSQETRERDVIEEDCEGHDLDECVVKTFKEDSETSGTRDDDDDDTDTDKDEDVASTESLSDCGDVEVSSDAEMLNPAAASHVPVVNRDGEPLNSAAPDVAAAAADVHQDDDYSEYETSFEELSEPSELSIGDEADSESCSSDSDYDSNSPSTLDDSNFSHTDSQHTSDDAEEFDGMMQPDSVHCLQYEDNLSTIDLAVISNETVNLVEPIGLQNICSDSFAAVPNNDFDPSEYSTVSEEIALECLSRAAGLSETYTMTLGIAEDCGVEVWWPTGLPEDHELIENRYELHVPCEGEYHGGVENQDSAPETDYGQFVMSGLDRTVPINTYKYVGEETASTSAPDSVTDQRSFCRQLELVASSEPQLDLVPAVRPGDQVVTFGVEEDEPSQVGGTREDDVFYVDLGQVEDGKHVDQGCKVVSRPAVEPDISPCELDEESEHETVYTDCEGGQLEVVEEVDVGQLTAGSSSQTELNAGDEAPHVGSPGTGAVNEDVYVAVPVMMNEDERLVDNLTVQTASDDQAEHGITGQPISDSGVVDCPITSGSDGVGGVDELSKCSQDVFETPADDGAHGKPDHEGPGYNGVSCDLDDIKCLVSAQPCYHSNKSVDSPASAAVTSVAMVDTNPMDYCRSPPGPGTRVAGDQTVDEETCDVSSDELLYAAGPHSPPSTLSLVIHCYYIAL